MAIGAIAGGAIGGAGINIVIRAVDQYSREFNKLEKGVKAQQTKFQKLTGFLKSTGLGYMALAGAAVGFAVSSVKSFLEVERAAQSFNIVVGETAGILLKDLRAASKGMVSDFGLMQAANSALMLGIDKNQLPELMEISAALGKVMGRTVTEAFNDITIGIGRQSRMILDNLGIIVNAEDAYKRYALQLGKTADALTETEKKQAFTNAVIEQGTALTEAMRYATETHTEKLQRLSAGWTNVKGSMGAAIVAGYDWIETLGKTAIAYDLWAEDVKDPKTLDMLQKLGNEIRIMYEETNKLRKENEAYLSDIEEMVKKRFPEEIELEKQKLYWREKMISATEDQQDEYKKEIDLIDDELERFDLWRDRQNLNIEGWQLMKDYSGDTMESIGQDVQTTMDMYDLNIEKIGEINQKIDDTAAISTAAADTQISDIQRVMSWLGKLESLFPKRTALGMLTGEPTFRDLAVGGAAKIAAKAITPSPSVGTAGGATPIGDVSKPSLGARIVSGVTSAIKKVGGWLGFEEGGIVPRTGPAIVHKGETIIPASKGAGVTIYINNLNGFNARDIANNLQDELEGMIKT